MNLQFRCEAKEPAPHPSPRDLVLAEARARVRLERAREGAQLPEQAVLVVADLQQRLLVHTQKRQPRPADRLGGTASGSSQRSQ